jgi:hypothetical protein
MSGTTGGMGGMRGWRRGLAAGLMLAVLGAAALGFLAAVRGGAQWLEARSDAAPLAPAWQEAVRVVLAGGRAVHLTPEQAAALRAEGRGRIVAARAAALARVDVRTRREVAGVFQAARGRVPDFLDWYYSLPGAYSRTFWALTGSLEGALGGELAARVLVPAEITAGLEGVARVLEQEAGTALTGAATGLGDAMLAGAAAAPPVAGDPPRVTASWELGGQVEALVAPYLAADAGELGRQAAAGAAGVAVAGTVGRRLAAAATGRATTALAARSARATLARLAARLGLRAAGGGGTAGAAAGGATAGASLCAASGAGAPLAPACAAAGGLAVGAVAWLLADKLLLEADEHLNRDELAAELLALLDAQEARVAEELGAALAARTGAAFDDLLAAFDRDVRPGPPPRDFVPLEALRARS